MESNTTLNKVKPILIEQAELFCDDVRRLLVYKSKIPRNVLIDYLKTITSFHLALYIHKVIYLLPKMIEAGTKDVVDDWSIVIDTTDDFESKVSSIAIAEAEKTYNSLYKYVKATFKINSIIQKLKLDESNSDSIGRALEVLKNELNQYETKFEAYWDVVYNEQDEDDKDLLTEMVKYETTYFDRYVELLLKVRGKRLHKDHIELLDSLSQK